MQVPKSVARPTTSRVRESLFSLLESRYALVDATVLDLFAGSGALSFEALSRGARFALLSDISVEAHRALEHNAQALGVSKSRCKILKGDTLREAVYQKAQSVGSYDYIFIDPPYAFTDEQITKILEHLQTYQLVASGGVVILESGRARALESTGFTEVLSKRYGSTVLQFLML